MKKKEKEKLKEILTCGVVNVYVVWMPWWLYSKVKIGTVALNPSLHP